MLSLPITSQAGFEPATVRLEGECSIQLSYYDLLINNFISILHDLLFRQHFS